jgi:hypothetical protein
MILPQLHDFATPTVNLQFMQASHARVDEGAQSELRKQRQEARQHNPSAAMHP